MKKKILIATFSVFLFVALSQTVLAVSWWPLVPCGTSVNPAECTTCDLFRLVKNIIDFVLIGLMPPLATLLFVWGGFLILMGGANPGLISQGKTICWNAAIGIAIISASWLITNTIIKSLAEESVTNPNVPWYQFECRETTGGGGQPPPTSQKYGCNQNNQCVINPNGQYTTSNCDNQCQAQPPSPTVLSIPTTLSLSGGIQNTVYSANLVATGGATPYTWSITQGTLPPGLAVNPSSGTISGTPTTVGTSTFTVKVEDSSSPRQSVTKQLSIGIVTQANAIIISSVASGNITSTGATITWTTNRAATSQVAYGATTTYGQSTTATGNQVTSHSVNITGLTPGTTYNYQAVSSVTGFTARSSNNVFRTTGTSTALLSISTNSLPSATQNTAYSQTLSATGGQTPHIWSLSTGNLPVGLSLSSSGTIAGTPTATGASTFTIRVVDGSTPQQSATRQLNIAVGTTSNTVTYGTCTGTACTRDTTDVCRAVDPGDGCDAVAVNNLNASIVSGVGNRTICSGIDTVKMLKTIIANESDGRIDIGSSDGQSAGPFQLTPATANRFKAQCGITETIDFNWLRRAENVDDQACIAAEFIQSFVGSCGCDARQIAAGYNGGPTACAASNACGQQAAANGGQCSACNVSRPTRKWECLWEDTQHNTCNIDRTGGNYSYTRIYAPRVEFCYNRF